MPQPSQSAYVGRAMATTYTVNLDAPMHEWITVVLTCLAGEGPHQPERDTWAVRKSGWCLDVDGDWIHEPIPSSRDDLFLSRTRYSLGDALDRAHAAARRIGSPTRSALHAGQASSPFSPWCSRTSSGDELWRSDVR